MTTREHPEGMPAATELLPDVCVGFSACVLAWVPVLPIVALCFLTPYALGISLWLASIAAAASYYLTHTDHFQTALDVFYFFATVAASSASIIALLIPWR